VTPIPPAFRPALRVVLLILVVGAYLPGTAGAQSGHWLPYSDEMVAEFARVRLRVQEIQVGYNERLREAGSSESAERLFREANELAARAIQESPLSFDLYQRMLADMGNDADFHRRVQFLMRQLNKAP